VGGLFTPARRRGVEWLDVTADPGLQCRSHRDIALSNRLFGGLRAVRAEVEGMLVAGGVVTLLDVGTGTGDVPGDLNGLARQRGVTLASVGVDGRLELVRQGTQARLLAGVCADALHLPFAPRSFDVVVASQLLHHFAMEDAVAVLRELDRVARRRVVISDLRRSWVAVGGLWLVSFPLRFHKVSRHDGVLSILRGFEAPELSAMIRAATGVVPRVRNRAGWRVTASWTPA
jgi:SAM-dependent methyltransferase